MKAEEKPWLGDGIAKAVCDLSCSTSVSWAELSKDATDPATLLWEQAFRKFKLQLDLDLHQFSIELRQTVVNLQSAEGLAQAEAACNDDASSTKQIASLLDLTTEFLTLNDAAFQESLPAVVTWLHGQRKACPHCSTLKGYYSRLLFLLSRCSQLISNNSNSGDEHVAYRSNNPLLSAAAAPGAVSVRLQRLLYGVQSQKPGTGRHSFDAGAASFSAARLAELTAECQQRPQQAGLQRDGGSFTATPQSARPVIARRNRRRSATVALNASAAADAVKESDSLRWDSPVHRHVIKRCNTMPVQHAEAMEQLLRQVRHCVSSGTHGQHVMAEYPLQPSSRSSLEEPAVTPGCTPCGGNASTDSSCHAQHLQPQELANDAVTQHVFVNHVSAEHSQQLDRSSARRPSVELSDFIAMHTAMESGAVPVLYQTTPGHALPMPQQLLESQSTLWSGKQQSGQGSQATSCQADGHDPESLTQLGESILSQAQLPAVYGTPHHTQLQPATNGVAYLSPALGGSEQLKQQAEVDSSSSSRSGTQRTNWIKRQWRSFKCWGKSSTKLTSSATSSSKSKQICTMDVFSAAVDHVSEVGTLPGTIDRAGAAENLKADHTAAQATVSSARCHWRLLAQSVSTITKHGRSLGCSDYVQRNNDVSTAVPAQAEVTSEPGQLSFTDVEYSCSSVNQSTCVTATAADASALCSMREDEGVQKQKDEGVSPADHNEQQCSPAQLAASVHAEELQQQFERCHQHALTTAQLLQQVQHVAAANPMPLKPLHPEAAPLLAGSTAAVHEFAEVQHFDIRSAPATRAHSVDAFPGSVSPTTLEQAALADVSASGPAGICQLEYRAGCQQTALHSRRNSYSCTAADPVGACATMGPAVAAGSLSSAAPKQHKLSTAGLGRHGSSRLSGCRTEVNRMSQQQQLAASPTPAAQPAAWVGKGLIRTMSAQSLCSGSRHGAISPRVLCINGTAEAVPPGTANSAAAGCASRPTTPGLPAAGSVAAAIAALGYPMRPGSPWTAAAAANNSCTTLSAFERAAVPAGATLVRCQSVGGGLMSLGAYAERGSYTSNASSVSGSFAVPASLESSLAARASLGGAIGDRPAAAATLGGAIDLQRQQSLVWRHAEPLVGQAAGQRTCHCSDSGAPQLTGEGSAGGSPGVALQARTIKCSICGHDVLGIITLRHNSLCGLLATEVTKLRGQAATADARLTVLANWMEDQLMHEVWPERLFEPLHQIIDVARLSASLQPDGTGMPEYRCTEAIEVLHCIHRHWWNRMQMLTLTETDAAKLAEGAADCDIVVTLCLRMIKDISDKLRWLAEPLPGMKSSNTSGTSTPRTAHVMQVSDFEMICPISRGAYGRVYKVKKKSTGDTFAIKVLTKTELVHKNMVESVTNERNILAMANNPFVVRFYYSFSSPEKLFLVMEYCPGGDLSSVLQHLGCFDEDVAKQYIAETVLALEYCHSKGIIHRDLKPDNLLVSNTGHIKLSDFGLSKFGGAAAAAEGATAAVLNKAATARKAGETTGQNVPSAQLSRSKLAINGDQMHQASCSSAAAAEAAIEGDTEMQRASTTRAVSPFAQAQVADANGGERTASSEDVSAALHALPAQGKIPRRVCSEPVKGWSAPLTHADMVRRTGSAVIAPSDAALQSPADTMAMLAAAIAAGSCSNICSVPYVAASRQQHKQQLRSTQDLQRALQSAMQGQQQQPSLLQGSAGHSVLSPNTSLLWQGQPTQPEAPPAAFNGADQNSTQGVSMEAAMQNIEACQLARMIPHTSLPSSPAVFNSKEAHDRSSSSTSRGLAIADAAACSSSAASHGLGMPGTPLQHTPGVASANSSGGSSAAAAAAAVVAAGAARERRRRKSRASAGCNIAWGSGQGVSSMMLASPPSPACGSTSHWSLMDTQQHQTSCQAQLRAASCAVAAGATKPVARLSRGFSSGTAVASSPQGASPAIAAEASGMRSYYGAAGSCTSTADQEHACWEQQSQEQPTGADSCYSSAWGQRHEQYGGTSASNSGASSQSLTKTGSSSDGVRSAQLNEYLKQAPSQGSTGECDSTTGVLDGTSQQQLQHAVPCMSAPVSAEQLQLRLQVVSEQQQQQAVWHQLHLKLPDKADVQLQHQQHQQLQHEHDIWQEQHHQYAQQLTATPKVPPISSGTFEFESGEASVSVSAGAPAAVSQMQLLQQELEWHSQACSGSNMKDLAQQSLSVMFPPESAAIADGNSSLLTKLTRHVCRQEAAAATAHSSDTPAGSSKVTGSDASAQSGASAAHLNQQQRPGSTGSQEQHQRVHSNSGNSGSQACTVKRKLKHASQPTQKALGTPDYLAPERLMGMTYGPEVDWWALGVILYEFVYGAPPFNAETPQEIFDRILDCNVEFYLDENGQHVVSEECRDLITKLLQGDPEKRLGHRGAGEVKLHPWFQGIEWGSLARQKAAFIPLDAPDTASYFVEKPFSKQSIAADLNPDIIQEKQQQRPHNNASSSRAKSSSGSGGSSSSPSGCRQSETAASAGAANSPAAGSAGRSSVLSPRHNTKSLQGTTGLAAMLNAGACVVSHPVHAGGCCLAAGTGGPATAWTPAGTPRSAVGSTPRSASSNIISTAVLVPPAFVAMSPCSTAAASAGAGGLSPLLVAVSPGVSPVFVAAAVNQPEQGVSSRNSSYGGCPGSESVRPSAVQQQYSCASPGTPVTSAGGTSVYSAEGHSAWRVRRSSSQIDGPQQLRRHRLRRWSTRALLGGASARAATWALATTDPCNQQQQHVVTPTPPHTCNDQLSVSQLGSTCSNSPATSGGRVRLAQLQQGCPPPAFAASLLDGHAQVQAEVAADANAASATASAQEVPSDGATAVQAVVAAPHTDVEKTHLESCSSTWGSSCLSPAASAVAAMSLDGSRSPSLSEGGATSLVAAAPPLLPQQTETSTASCPARNSSHNDIFAASMCRTPAGVVAESAAGVLQMEDWQQQLGEQLRKARKSKASSPQQRLKHQWAQQHIQHLQQQQHVVTSEACDRVEAVAGAAAAAVASVASADVPNGDSSGSPAKGFWEQHNSWSVAAAASAPISPRNTSLIAAAAAAAADRVVGVGAGQQQLDAEQHMWQHQQFGESAVPMHEACQEGGSDIACMHDDTSPAGIDSMPAADVVLAAAAERLSQEATRSCFRHRDCVSPKPSSDKSSPKAGAGYGKFSASHSGSKPASPAGKISRQQWLNCFDASDSSAAICSILQQTEHQQAAVSAISASWVAQLASSAAVAGALGTAIAVSKRTPKQRRRSALTAYAAEQALAATLPKVRRYSEGAAVVSAFAAYAMTEFPPEAPCEPLVSGQNVACSAAASRSDGSTASISAVLRQAAVLSGSLSKATGTFSSIGSLDSWQSQHRASANGAKCSTETTLSNCIQQQLSGLQKGMRGSLQRQLSAGNSGSAALMSLQSNSGSSFSRAESSVRQGDQHTAATAAPTAEQGLQAAELLLHSAGSNQHDNLMAIGLELCRATEAKLDAGPDPDHEGRSGRLSSGDEQSLAQWHRQQLQEGLSPSMSSSPTDRRAFSFSSWCSDIKKQPLVPQSLLPMQHEAGTATSSQQLDSFTSHAVEQASVVTRTGSPGDVLMSHVTLATSAEEAPVDTGGISAVAQQSAVTNAASVLPMAAATSQPMGDDSPDGSDGELSSRLCSNESQGLKSEDLDAFGDFTAVNVTALQELNREKQQAELLEPLAQAVSGIGGDYDAVANAAAEQHFQQYRMSQLGSGGVDNVDGLQTQHWHHMQPQVYVPHHQVVLQHLQHQQQLHWAHAGYVYAPSNNQPSELQAAMQLHGDCAAADDIDDEIVARYSQGQPPDCASGVPSTTANMQHFYSTATVPQAALDGSTHAATAAANPAAEGVLMVEVLIPTSHVEQLQHFQQPQQFGGVAEQEPNGCGMHIEEQQQLMLVPCTLLLPPGSSVPPGCQLMPTAASNFAAEQPLIMQAERVPHLDWQHCGALAAAAVVDAHDMNQEAFQDVVLRYMSEPLPELNHSLSTATDLFDASTPESAPLPAALLDMGSTRGVIAAAAAPGGFQHSEEHGHGDAVCSGQLRPAGLTDHNVGSIDFSALNSQPDSDISMLPGSRATAGLDSAAAVYQDGPTSAATPSAHGAKLRRAPKASFSTSHLEQLMRAPWLSEPGAVCNLHASKSMNVASRYVPSSGGGVGWCQRCPGAAAYIAPEANSGMGLRRHQSTVTPSWATMDFPVSAQVAGSTWGMQQRPLTDLGVGGIAPQYAPSAYAPHVCAYAYGSSNPAQSSSGATEPSGRIIHHLRQSSGGAQYGYDPLGATTLGLQQHADDGMGSGSLLCNGVVTPAPVGAADAAAVAPGLQKAVSKPAGKDFLAQLSAIAADGTRGYKYRASDSGQGARSFLQRAATGSLPGTFHLRGPGGFGASVAEGTRFARISRAGSAIDAADDAAAAAVSSKPAS